MHDAGICREPGRTRASPLLPPRHSCANRCIIERVRRAGDDLEAIVDNQPRGGQPEEATPGQGRARLGSMWVAVVVLLAVAGAALVREVVALRERVDRHAEDVAFLREAASQSRRQLQTIVEQQQGLQQMANPAAADCSRAQYSGWDLSRTGAMSAQGLVGKGRATLAAAETIMANGLGLKEQFDASGLYVEEREGLVWSATPNGLAVERGAIHTLVVILKDPTSCPRGPILINEVPLSFVVRRGGPG